MTNPNATYKCTVSNDYGQADNQITNQEIRNYSEETAQVASMPVIIAVGAAVLVVFLIGGIVAYRYILKPRQSDKGGGYTGGYPPYTSKSDQIITGDYGTPHQPPNFDHGQGLLLLNGCHLIKL